MLLYCWPESCKLQVDTGTAFALTNSYKECNFIVLNILGFPATISFCHVIIFVGNTGYLHFYMLKKSLIWKERHMLTEDLCISPAHIWTMFQWYFFFFGKHWCLTWDYRINKRTLPLVKMCPHCNALDAQEKLTTNPNKDFPFLFLDGYGARELACRWRSTGPRSYLLEWWTWSIPSHSSWTKAEIQGNECWWVIFPCSVSSCKDLCKSLLSQYHRG